MKVFTAQYIDTVTRRCSGQLHPSALGELLLDSRLFLRKCAKLIQGRPGEAALLFWLTQRGLGWSQHGHGWPKRQQTELAAVARTFEPRSLYRDRDGLYRLGPDFRER